MRPRLDDVEAEISYLTVRALRPRTVLELGAARGWSTTWLLRALRDNATAGGDGGVLHSYDLTDAAARHVPAALAGDRWRFTPGDARRRPLPADPGFVLLDAAHTARFARWYTTAILERLPPGAAVAVHDVYHHRRPGPVGEGAVVLGWLRRRGIGHLTASSAADPDTHDRLLGLKRKLRLAAPVHAAASRNPMLFFRTPGRGCSAAPVSGYGNLRRCPDEDRPGADPERTVPLPAAHRQW
ncbi:class I SAM-dependent methyltransferase [Dactylosporangium aurantiacum]|uniref:Class I SAM-dependent methyltransferase n=2 Tax=Dactylosporangium aurantiacum TaxID=35754 RepID=A0A9Q9IE02_9ACTN|nr:class I SAM-dependent methyltransferase [Dactylosporangium aurantiacum]UWZ52580.1 class I SAM-dependent methyltransferase [Dactylosporangium aurantiacum]